MRGLLRAVREVVVVLAVAIAPAAAQEVSVRPDVNRAYEDADYDRWAEIFEHEGREVYDRRHDIVAATGVQAGMDVADIGAGTGLFTRLFASAADPSGTVYAVDINETFVRNTERRAREAGLKNVTGIVNDARSTGLAANSVDLAFLADTYHHFEYPQDMLASIHQALRPDGRLIVIDFRKQEGESSRWVMDHVRADRETVVEEIEAAGFRLLEDVPLLETNYFLRFEPVPRQ